MKLRVAFLTNLTTQESLPVLHELSRSQQAEVAQVFFYDTISHSRKSLLHTIREFGLRGLVVKSTKILSGKALVIASRLFPALKPEPRTSFEFAAKHQLPVRVVSTLNSPDSQNVLKSLELDVLLVCVCKNILKQTTIDIPTLGSVNIHPSLLPQYRGPAPVFWALYNRETVTGVTFQQMTKSIDDGPILAQYPMAIPQQVTEQQLSRSLLSLAAEHLDAVLSLLLSRLSQSSSNESTGSVSLDDAEDVATPSHSDRSAKEPSSYFSFPTPAQRKELARRR
jgi:folate-dependent phosphoribosylglycinamide formyltransferase PurN